MVDDRAVSLDRQLIRAILFDLDGVLINSDIVIKAAFTLSYREVVGAGQPPIDEYFSHMGDSFENIMRKMSLPLEMHAPFKDFSSRLITLIELYPTVRELLEQLRQQCLKLAVVTGKDRGRTVEILRALGIGHYFDGVVTSDDVRHAKPHPEPLEQAMGLLQAERDECLMVGDAHNDLVAARRAGIRSAAATWGALSIDALLAESPTYVVDNPLQLLELVAPQTYGWPTHEKQVP